MPETVSRGSGTGTFATAVRAAVTGTPACGAVVPGPSARPHRFRGRIGVGLAGGFYPAPHRYQLYLSEGCQRSLRVSITLALLGLENSTATTVLTRPAETPDAFAALRRAYEATWHHYDGPLTAPALCDRWSGRVVSNHTPDILRDLADLSGLRDEEAAGLPALRPPSLAAEIDALRELLARDVTPTARPAARAATLSLLDHQLSSRRYVLGDEITAADVDLWVALTHLGTDGAPTACPRLDAYVRRLGRHPAFAGGVRAAR
ncbi:putative glutathione S-transferase [Streptomyces sp. V3I8]|uniref:glutathione S-transferase family protein n=1 Tax=Streptomyces sp. V3I8 TaxID=3042279 RepID=UPI002781C124|nr:glutathione S-transferase C-terminal domain-containing protein [Streptomyces sp. V3I8]MDQ1034786.1 putative glutathione S-transferase [Streptomyces sp. V3I8]